MAAADVHYFAHDGNRLAYRTFGRGPSVLLAFHGFGQSSLVFGSVQPVLNDYTIVAVDLFYHGDSQYAADQLLTKSTWQRLLDALLRAQGADRFSLLGFSLGGRFALAAVEAFADRLDQLILIAPDGITRSPWYRLATGSGAGRGLFRFVLGRLPLFHTMGHALVRLKVLNRTAMRFAEISLNTPEQRTLVFRAWTQFRLIWPDLNAIGALLNRQPVQVRFFTGAFDRIVPGHYILPLTRRLRHYELTVFRTGHNHLIELTADHLAQRPLQDPPKPDDRNENQAHHD